MSSTGALHVFAIRREIVLKKIGHELSGGQIVKSHDISDFIMLSCWISFSNENHLNRPNCTQAQTYSCHDVMCLVVTCWERADLLVLVCGVLLCVCYFPIGIMGQVWHLIVSIPDLCTLSYFYIN